MTTVMTTAMTTVMTTEFRPRYTRRDYVQNRCTHEQYYEQFVKASTEQDVVSRIGAERLLASKDKHLNDIPLWEWDSFFYVFQLDLGWSYYSKAFEAAGDSAPGCRANAVCLAKAAARVWLDKQGEGA